MVAEVALLTSEIREQLIDAVVRLLRGAGTL
jgi:hypothetical protein